MVEDIFTARKLGPMAVGREASLGELQDELDFSDFITELKFDGMRVLAYLDPTDSSTVLVSRNGKRMEAKFPEFAELAQRVKARCILDGEVLAYVDGAPNFEEVLRRLSMSKKMEIDWASKRLPVTYVAFDILYLKDHSVMDEPQMKRKSLLRNTVRDATGTLALSEFIEGDPEPIFHFAESRDLEGIVVKRKTAAYQPGRESNDWIKVKNHKDDDFVICGYIPSEKVNVATLILGQYDGNQLLNVGHVILGKAKADFKRIQAVPAAPPPFRQQADEAGAIWLKPELVCTVRFQNRTSKGKLRHTRYKELRPDLRPADAVFRETTQRR